jgi:hypothetical protein
MLVAVWYIHLTAENTSLIAAMLLPQHECIACRDQQLILLRPKDFQQHSLHYIIRCCTPASSAAAASAATAPSASSSSTLTCWRVPRHLMLQPWQQLLQQPQQAQQLQAAQLVLLQQSPILPVLGKFEQLQFVHAYAPGSGSTSSSGSTPDPTISTRNRGSTQPSWQLRFELPRFSLEFELQQDGQLLSRDHTGFKLSSCQQLVWQEGCQGLQAASDSSSSIAFGRSDSTNSEDSVQTGCTAAAALAGGQSSSIGSASSMSISSSSSSSLQGAEAAAVEYTLPGFQRYLVLERVQRSTSVFGAAVASERMVLAPAGQVVCTADGPTIKLGSSVLSRIQVGCIVLQVTCRRALP